METHPRVLIDLRRKPQPTDWTPEQLDNLRRMAGKAPIAEIAVTIGRTPNGVKVKARSLRLSLATTRYCRPWSASEIATLRAMRNTHALQQVADMLGRSLESVSSKAKVERIAYRKHGEVHAVTKYSRETIEQVFQLREQGNTQSQIAERLGMCRQHVSGLLNFKTRYRETMQIYGELP